MTQPPKQDESSMEADKAFVLARVPDAVAMQNDYYSHWIGREPLSDGFQEDDDALREAYRDRSLPSETIAAKINAIEDAAEAKAWAEARQRLESQDRMEERE